MDYANPHALVSTDWLAHNLGGADLVLLDASWHLTAAGRDARAEYAEAHIPGAVYFDIDHIAEPPESGLPHMIPPAEIFRSRVGALGVGNGASVVVYDAYGGPLAAARAWWMLRLFGHRKVAMLDGGLPKWRAENSPLESTPPATQSGHFTARFDKSLIRDLDQVRTNLVSAEEQVLDARSPGRFKGTEPEVRDGVRSGHIPGSINLPFQLFLDEQRHFAMRPADELQAIFTDAGVDPTRPVISSCGSGVTACVAILALYLLGHEKAAVYDGSWTEWGGRTDTPIEV